MGKPEECGIAANNYAAHLPYGLSGCLFEAGYLTWKSNNGKAPPLPEPEENIDRLSCIKWKSWHVSLPAKADGEKRPISSEQLKDLTPLVRIIAQKIHRPLPANVMLNDLIQDGMIGLITAMEEHDSSLGIPFRAYAENKIRWAIMDGLRAGDWAGRSLRRRATKVAKTTARLQALLGREPSKQEIADELEVHVDDIAGILGEAHGYNFIRIDDAPGGETQDIPDSRMEPQPIVERREVYSRAMAGLKTLRPNERRALILRTLCELSVMQTAEEMGVSESRVSQLCRRASEKLANHLRQ